MLNLVVRRSKDGLRMDLQEVDVVDGDSEERKLEINLAVDKLNEVE